MTLPHLHALYDVVRATLELLFYLSAGPGLVYVAVLALEQLRITKRDITTRVTREAAKETAEQLDVWATQIIPILNDLTVAEDGIERPRRTHPMERFDRQELLAAPIADLVILRKALDLLNAKPVQKLTLQACNLIEASAMRFIDGVADEQKAFMPLSSTFCHFVERTYYFYCSMRNKDDQLNRWAYTLKLYRVWSQRRIKFELDAKQQSLAEALTAATENATPVLPIGL